RAQRPRHRLPRPLPRSPAPHADRSPPCRLVRPQQLAPSPRGPPRSLEARPVLFRDRLPRMARALRLSLSLPPAAALRAVDRLAPAHVPPPPGIPSRAPSQRLRGSGLERADEADVRGEL